MDGDVKNALYQKIGDHWYIFVESQGDVIYTRAPKDYNPANTNFLDVQLYEVVEEDDIGAVKQAA